MMATRDVWDWVLIGAQVFSAIGTVGATIAAVWLGLRISRARFKVTIAHVDNPSRGVGNLLLTFVSTGSVPVSISMLEWWCAGKKEVQWDWDLGGDDLPITWISGLLFGEHRSVLIRKEDFSEQLSDWHEDAWRFRCKGCLRGLKLVAIATTGEKVSVRAPEFVRQLAWEAIERGRKAPRDELL